MTAPPPRSGGEHDGSAAGNGQWTMADVNALPRTAAGGDELQDAIDLGYGPTKNRN